jgi:predicted amidohydrolase YtcJ
LYTIGSAWFAHDDDMRGSLEVGKAADLAVLSQDYMTAPVDRLGANRIATHDGQRQGRLRRRALQALIDVERGLQPARDI